jgi:polysaccharide export outer membrane protein
MRVLLILATILAALASSLGVAWAQQPAKPPAAPAAAGGSLDAFKIGPEDVLSITVWKNDAMSRTVQVRPDGKISLPLLDDIEAAGLTPMQLRDVLAKRLAEYIPNPEVSVIVRDVRSFRVSVIGEVAKPGRLELKSWTTVLDVLAQSGGFTQFAARSRIVILRPNGKTMTRIPFNYNKVVSSGGEEENIYLQPGDIVLVP